MSLKINTQMIVYYSLYLIMVGQEIDLTHCDNITDAGLAYLSGVRNITLWGCRNITDAGLSHLSGVQEIDLRWCDNITDAGLAHLTGVQHINLTWCRNITNNGLFIYQLANRLIFLFVIK